MISWNNNQNNVSNFGHSNSGNNFSASKDQEIKILKVKNKKKMYIIFYLIFGFSLIVSIICLKNNQFSDISNAININDKIESENLESENNCGKCSDISENNNKEISAVEIYKKCAKSVVGIVVNQGDSSLFETQGSGVIIRPDGYILTNNHVIEGCCNKNSKLYVFVEEGSEPIKGTLVGRDEILDLAVIKIEKKDLPVIKIGDSSNLCEGQKVFAIGNPQGLQRSMTDGIISALDRKIGNSAWNTYIQTNANINPGNSGGALIDSNGQLIGINTAKLDKSEGIGFAIPSSVIKKVLDNLIKNGHVIRPAIGVSISENLIIKNFSKNSDLRKFANPGDMIIGINNKTVKTTDDIIEEIKEKSVGDKVSVSIQDFISKKIFAVDVELKELDNS